MKVGWKSQIWKFFKDIYDKKEKIATFYFKIDKLKYGENIINFKNYNK